jgi:hypothetical protein
VKFSTQYLVAQKRGSDSLQFILTPETALEKSMLGAAQMLAPVAETNIEDDGSMTFTFKENQ